MSEALVQLENLNLVLRASVHRPWSWRDVFVRTLKNPLSLWPSAGDRLPIIQDLNLEVFAGDRLALVGVNGVGKTSLCRCIAGYYRPTSGKIRIKGRVRALFDVAVGIQPELTGRENAVLLAELLFPEEKDKTQMIEQALEFSELGNFLDVPFRLYSTGMQTRLGLSMAALRASDVLILDEVFDGADLFFREKIAARMRELVRDSGAVIFVSHEPEEIKEVCNRLVVFHQGKILFDGAVEEGLRFYRGLKPLVQK
jgi:ABC-type polysaccharide/polyol phosphate transport system ATPase subunit